VGKVLSGTPFPGLGLIADLNADPLLWSRGQKGTAAAKEQLSRFSGLGFADKFDRWETEFLARNWG